MATYGFPPPGFTNFTGFSPTLGVPDAVTPVTSGQVQFNGLNQNDEKIARLLDKGPNRIVRRLLLTTIGAAAGATATENRTRVMAQPANFSPNDYGGVVPIETVPLINRATTAADVTALQAMISVSPIPGTYPVDPSGNGGGGKLGY